MSKQINDVVIMNSPTRRRGDGKPAVMVLFSKILGWWIPEYEELAIIIDRLVDINGKEEVEEALGVIIQ